MDNLPSTSKATQYNTSMDSIPSTSKSTGSPQLLGILNNPPKSARPVTPRLVPPQTLMHMQAQATAAKAFAGPSTSSSTSNPITTDQRPTLTLQNVVGTVNLACTLDLFRINSRMRNSEYNPQRFSGLVMRIREPRTTSLVFQSGKMVITGAKSEADCNLAARKMARIIQKLGFRVRFIGFRVTNIVATCDLKFPIRVETLNMIHGQFSSYEPELFPGLIYRMVHPRVVILVFVNGKLCFTGAKSQEDLLLALDNIYPILKSFKKQ